MALLLAFDTATPYLSVVLARAGRPLASRTDASPKLSHAEQINVFIAELMREAGHALADLDAVAVGIGPGSYTGLRIGLSAAKGLCFALEKPLIGMGTLEVLFAEAQCKQGLFADGDLLFPMVDARRMEVYTRPFSPTGEPLGAMVPVVLDMPWCQDRGKEGRVHVFGDGADKAEALWEACPDITHLSGICPGVEGLAKCAEAHFRDGRFADLAYLVPEYGKPANVAQKRGAE